MIKTSIDKNGTLYFFKEGEISDICEHAPNDMNIVLSLNKSKEIIGITIVGGINSEEWLKHADRDCIPPDFIKRIDYWVKNFYISTI